MGRSTYTSSTVSHLVHQASHGSTSSTWSIDGNNSSNNLNKSTTTAGAIASTSSSSNNISAPWLNLIPGGSSRQHKDAPTLWAAKRFDPDDEALPVVEERFLSNNEHATILSAMRPFYPGAMQIVDGDGNPVQDDQDTSFGGIIADGEQPRNRTRTRAAHGPSSSGIEESDDDIHDDDDDLVDDDDDDEEEEEDEEYDTYQGDADEDNYHRPMEMQYDPDRHDQYLSPVNNIEEGEEAAFEDGEFLVPMGWRPHPPQQGLPQQLLSEEQLREEQQLRATIARQALELRHAQQLRDIRRMSAARTALWQAQDVDQAGEPAHGNQGYYDGPTSSELLVITSDSLDQDEQHENAERRWSELMRQQREEEDEGQRRINARQRANGELLFRAMPRHENENEDHDADQDNYHDEEEGNLAIDRRTSPGLADDFSPSAGVFHTHTLPFSLPNVGEMQMQRRVSSNSNGSSNININGNGGTTTRNRSPRVAYY